MNPVSAVMNRPYSASPVSRQAKFGHEQPPVYFSANPASGAPKKKSRGLLWAVLLMAGLGLAAGPTLVDKFTGKSQQVEQTAPDTMPDGTYQIRIGIDFGGGQVVPVGATITLEDGKFTKLGTILPSGDSNARYQVGWQVNYDKSAAGMDNAVNVAQNIAPLLVASSLDYFLSHNAADITQEAANNAILNGFTATVGEGEDAQTIDVPGIQDALDQAGITATITVDPMVTIQDGGGEDGNG